MLSRKIRLGENNAIWIAGPASIEVSRGSLKLLGSRYGSGARLIIPRFRSYVATSDEEALLTITLGEGGECQAVEPDESLEKWEEAAEMLVDRGGAVLVLGSGDSGKTTFTALASNKALSKGVKPAVIDGDVGQADIGPPGFASMAYPGKPVLWLRELKAKHMAFVGHISPASAPGMVVSALHTLRRVAEGDPVVIDTDGWMNSAKALHYKYMLIEVLEPSTIILLGGRYASFFEKASRITGAKLQILPLPPSRRLRGRSDRRLLRSEAYKRYLENTSVVEARLEDIMVLGSCLYAGTPLSDAELRAVEDLTGLRILAASRSDTLVLVVEDGLTPEAVSEVRRTIGQAVIIEKGGEKGLLAAVIGKTAADQAPAIIEKINYDEGIVLLRTRWKDEIRGIHIGRIRLNEEYVEERVAGCPI